MKKIVVLGGDLRQKYLLQALRKAGFEVSEYGISSCNENWKEILHLAKVLILPLPVSTDGLHIPFSFFPNFALRYASVLQELKEHTLILGGKIPQEWMELAKEKGHFIKDYFQSESLQQANALPTVEGAIRIALEELPVHLQGSEVAVAGYGRIGRLLCEKLQLLGAKVSLFARKEQDLSAAAVRGILPIAIKAGATDFSLLSKNCRILFNTVPAAWVEELSTLPKDLVWVELASFPGGVNPSLFQKAAQKYILASGLPGKFYPESAGEILAKTLIPMITSENSFETPSY